MSDLVTIRLHPRLSRPLLGLVVLLSLLAPSAGAQGDADSGLFFDTVDVNVINVEVIVTDAEGNPMTGLTREDFELYEDGERMELSNFFAIEGRQTVATETGEILEAGGFVPKPETQRMNLIIFVDDLNLTPQNRNQIFENLRGYLAQNLDPRDRVMLVHSDQQVEIAQEFTNDPSTLGAAIEKIEKNTGRHSVFAVQKASFLRQIDQTPLLTSRPSAPLQAATRDAEFTANAAEALANELRFLAEQSTQKTRQTIAALKTFSDSLAAMRGRKAILYVSDGLPLRPAEPLVQAWLNKFESWALENDETGMVTRLTSLNTTEFDTSQAFNELVAYVSTNRVALYPLSNSGRAVSSRVSAEISGAGASALGARSLDVVNLDNFSKESALLRMAEDTGGIAFTRSSNIGGLIDRIAQDFGTFYSLGYAAPERDTDAFHKIEVEVDRPGARVRHLKGYRQKDPLENLKDLTLSALHHGLGENALDVRLTPGEQSHTKGKRYRVPVMVQIPFEKLLLLPETEHHTGQVTVFVIVQDLETGAVSAAQQIELPIKIRNDRLAEALGQIAAYPLQLDMKKGPKKISLGVRDHLGRTDATVSLEVDVGAEG